LLTGDRGVAGELGHSTLVADGRLCTCGRRGCLEAYAGGWAIAARAREAIEADPEGGRAIREEAGEDTVTALTVSRAAAVGDPLAARLLAETGRYLGAGIVGLVHALNPRRIVLGGGVIDGNPHLVDLVAATVEESAIPIFSDRLDVKHSELGSQAGVVGSASMARHHHAADRMTSGAG
jgi:glucokinase